MNQRPGIKSFIDLGFQPQAKIILYLVLYPPSPSQNKSNTDLKEEKIFPSTVCNPAIVY